MKVLKDFFCTQTKVSYKSGEEYKGDRKDIDHLLDKKKRKPRAKKEVEPVEKKEVAPIAKEEVKVVAKSEGK